MAVDTWNEVITNKIPIIIDIVDAVAIIKIIPTNNIAIKITRAVIPETKSAILILLNIITFPSFFIHTILYTINTDIIYT